MDARLPVLLQDELRYAAMQLATHLRDESPIRQHMETICGALERQGWDPDGLQGAEELADTHYGHIALAMIRGILDCPRPGVSLP